MTLERHALSRGVAMGLILIVPATVVITILDHNVDNFDDSIWLVVLSLVVLAAYIVTGFTAGRAAPGAPFAHGAIAALIVFGGWFLVGVAVRAVQGDSLDIGVKGLVTNVLLAATFGLLGGAFSARESRV
jgi:putative membrane protein (TIGR04086 family)